MKVEVFFIFNILRISGSNIRLVRQREELNCNLNDRDDTDKAREEAIITSLIYPVEWVSVTCSV